MRRSQRAVSLHGPVLRRCPVRPALQRVALPCRRAESPADEPGCPPSPPPSSCVEARPPPCRPPGSRRDLRQPRRPHDREPRAAPAACRPAAEDSPAPPSRHRPPFRAGPAPLVAPRGDGARHRSARSRHVLASQGLPTVRAPDIAAQRCTPEHHGQHPRSRPRDGSRESVEHPLVAKAKAVHRGARMDEPGRRFSFR